MLRRIAPDTTADVGPFIDTAVAILSHSERQVDVCAQNIANITTPGYKRRLSFSGLLSPTAASSSSLAQPNVAYDFSAGKLNNTGKPYDLALAGDGFFVVQGPNGLLYTRNGQFRLSGDGRLTTADGYPLQLQGGGDLILHGGTLKVLEDGSVSENGEAIGQLAVTAFADPAAAHYVTGDLITTPDSNLRSLARPTVHQGMLEASNVSVGAEMVSIMAALRTADTGGRLVTAYDDLMGRVISSLGAAT